MTPWAEKRTPPWYQMYPHHQNRDIESPFCNNSRTNQTTDDSSHEMESHCVPPLTLYSDVDHHMNQELNRHSLLGVIGEDHPCCLYQNSETSNSVSSNASRTPIRTVCNRFRLMILID